MGFAAFPPPSPTLQPHTHRHGSNLLLDHESNHVMSGRLCKVLVGLAAPVYDILPPTTAIVDDAVSLGKLLANEQFFVDAQTAVRLSQQTTQIIGNVAFITDHVAYDSTNKTKNHLKTCVFLTRGGCVSCLRRCSGRYCCFHSLTITRALWEGADRVGGQLRGDEVALIQWRNQFWQSLEEGAAEFAFTPDLAQTCFGTTSQNMSCLADCVRSWWGCSIHTHTR